MGRPRRERKSKYKTYYEPGAEDQDVPESTLRYRATAEERNNRLRLREELSDVSSEDEEDPNPDAGTSNENNILDLSDLSTIVSGNEADGRINETLQQVPSSTSADSDLSEDSDSSASLSSCLADVSSSDEEVLPNMSGARCRSLGNIISIRGTFNENACYNEIPASEKSTSSESSQHASEASESSYSDLQSSDLSICFSNSTSSASASCASASSARGEIGEEMTAGAFSRLKATIPKILNVNVNISIGEVLTNLLILVKSHNLSHLLKEDIMKFVNSIVNAGNVLPCTRFLLDEYLYSKEDMTFHFYCKECTEFLGSVLAESARPNQICCPNSDCKSINLLSDLSQASYFVTFDIPIQVELILSDGNLREKLLNPLHLADAPEPTILKDVYDGKMYRNFAKTVINDPKNASAQVISFILSVDSASLCSFSGQAICPCFLMILELPPVLRMKHLLLAGLWFGRVKEKLDLYLPPIVKHITELSDNGFTVDVGAQNRLFMRAYLLGCCADSVARCAVQGVHAHRGDFPCSWCVIEGEEFGNTRIFRYGEPCDPRTLAQLMNDASEALRTCTVVNGVRYLCPLAPAPLFHSIDGFIVDQMHAKDEGTTKHFLKAWLGEDGKTNYYIGSPSKRKILNSRIKQVKPPKEFRKAVRDFDSINHWTGREFENFALFLSIPVVKDILPDRFLKHWALYVQALYILLLSAIPIDAIDIAEALLEEFCMKTETLYALHMMRFNLHILRHFCDNCRRWGNLYALSAYAFEAGNQRVKKLVHDCNYIPNQICRGISENNALVLLKTLCATNTTKSFEEAINRKPNSSASNFAGDVRLMGHGRRFRATTGEENWFIENLELDPSHLVQYDQIIKDGCCYESSLRRRQTKRDNSYALLKTDKIVLIKAILHDEQSNNVWIICSTVRCEPSQFVPQAVVRFKPSLSFQFIVRSIDEDIEFLAVDQLLTICVSMKFDHGHYVSPMPNVINMF